MNWFLNDELLILIKKNYLFGLQETYAYAMCFEQEEDNIICKNISLSLSLYRFAYNPKSPSSAPNDIILQSNRKSK